MLQFIDANIQEPKLLLINQMNYFFQLQGHARKVNASFFPRYSRGPQKQESFWIMQQNMHVVLTNTLSFFQLYVVQTQKVIVLLDSLLSCFIFVSFL